MVSRLGFPPAWRRVAATAAVFFLLATAGTAAVVAGLSTTTGYTVGIGPTVSELPPDATVVEADRLPAAVRDRVADLADDDARVRLERLPVDSLGGPVYLSYEGAYYAMDVTPRRTLTGVGYLALGAVYLLSLAAGVSVPTRVRPHVH